MIIYFSRLNGQIEYLLASVVVVLGSVDVVVGSDEVVVTPYAGQV